MQPSDFKVQPYGVTIFCDDIRHEVGGKATYVGCYPDLWHVAASHFPITLPQLCLAVTYVVPASWPKGQLQINVFLPGDRPENPTAKPIFDIGDYEVPAGIELDADDMLVKKLTTYIVLSHAKILKPGSIKVRAVSAGVVTKLGVLEVVTKQERVVKAD
jgi:hypothetical protein